MELKTDNIYILLKWDTREFIPSDNLFFDILSFYVAYPV